MTNIKFVYPIIQSLREVSVWITLNYIKVGQELFARFVAKSPEDPSMKSIRRVGGLLSAKNAQMKSLR